MHIYRPGMAAMVWQKVHPGSPFQQKDSTTSSVMTLIRLPRSSGVHVLDINICLVQVIRCKVYTRLDQLFQKMGQPQTQ